MFPFPSTRRERSKRKRGLEIKLGRFAASYQQGHIKSFCENIRYNEQVLVLRVVNTR